MKKYILFLLTICISITLVGCIGISKNKSLKEKDEDTIIDMTKEEETLLCSIYVNEDRIKEGKLYDYQLDALMQFRNANEYLEDKYPSYDFKYFAYHPSNKSNDTSILEFTVDDTENYFIVEIEEKNDEYIITDNLYAYILRPLFDDMLTDKLENAGLTDFYVYTKMSGKFGEELDENATIEDILSFETDMKRDIDIYIDMSPYDEDKKQEIANIVEKELRDLNNYGACIIYFEDGISNKCFSSEECLEYRKKNRMESITFNTFDLR